ncbi:dienelactone hydrolase family protein [Peterkaempfera sp. SMS 1(5)a]|uniref:dienelactone hydrolase family protein n=1 Tax=Peterkaempfera podocarpi TaxID=3232308 RepID=UPI00366F3C5E
MEAALQQQAERRGTIGTWARIPVDGSAPMDAYVSRPTAPGRYPRVLVGFEMFGVTPYIRDVADRLAESGHVAVVPDFHHRAAPGVQLTADDEGRRRGFELIGQLTRPGVLADLAAVIGWLDRQEYAGAGTAMVGLSLGGHISYYAATQLDLAATVVFYGGWLTGTDIPLSRPEPTVELSAGIREHNGRLLFLTGADDHLLDAAQREVIADRLTAAGVAHEMVVYPAPHGFFCHERDSYRPEAAEDAWRRTLELLAARLAPEAGR